MIASPQALAGQLRQDADRLPLMIGGRRWATAFAVAVFPWLGLFCGCGGGASATSDGGADGGDSDTATTLTATCDDPPATFGSCRSGSQCVEAVNEFAASVNESICLPDLGATPSAQPCSNYGLVGRCFEPDPGVWRSYYGGAGSAASLRASCEQGHGLWCTNPAGVPAKLAAQCVSACKAAEPDFKNTPECRDASDCKSACWRALTAPTQACADCVTGAINWPPGSCGASECFCDGPTFGDCATACAK